MDRGDNLPGSAIRFGILQLEPYDGAIRGPERAPMSASASSIVRAERGRREHSQGCLVTGSSNARPRPRIRSP